MKSLVLLALLAGLAAAQSPLPDSDCPEELASTCIECDINNKCVECKLGYYVIEGVCLACMTGCVDCEQKASCKACTAGFALNNSVCVECHKNCVQCVDDPENCLECKEDYNLDLNNVCHYKYTLYLLLAATIFVSTLVCGITVIVRKCAELGRPQLQAYDSVLDDESRRKGALTVVSHVHEIGQTEDDRDISVVESFKKAPDVRSFINNSYVGEHPEEDIIQSLKNLGHAPGPKGPPLDSTGSLQSAQ